ncbi:peptidoglycan-binding protein LysM [Gangjinia marincola]|uniref:Peptidoglycan-binding protein LysM n=1 Tax=Gangjinia marincola TaxID=578463 RepID=A0ABP3XQN7_9FLAO
MKKGILYSTFLSLVGIFAFSAFSSGDKVMTYYFAKTDLPEYYTVAEPNAFLESGIDERVYFPSLGDGYLGFKEALGFQESGGDYFVINQFGYRGKYQFGRSTLNTLGLYDVREFLNSPLLQEKAFYANCARNKWVLRRDIKRFEGKWINGVKVTESGILAAAHLAGPGSVKGFLRSYGEKEFADGFGTTISYYLKKFAGYDLSFIKADKEASITE